MKQTETETRKHTHTQETKQNQINQKAREQPDKQKNPRTKSNK